MVSAQRVAKLVAQLEQGDAKGRREAAKRLGRSGSRAAVPSLCDALMGDSDWRVRQSAARALGLLRAEEAVPPLLEVVGHRSLGVRRACLEALGGIGDLRAVEPLCAALSDRKLANTALAILVDLGPPAVAQLCRAFHEADGALRGTYLYELIENHAGALRQIFQRAPQETLFAILADVRLTGEQRCYALERLREARTAWFRPPLVGDAHRFCERTLRESESEAERRGAREVLDYLTLARASSAGSGAGRDTLLRAASPGGGGAGADTLLRASDADGGPDNAAPPAPLSWLARLRAALSRAR